MFGHIEFFAAAEGGESLGLLVSELVAVAVEAFSTLAWRCYRHPDSASGAGGIRPQAVRPRADDLWKKRPFMQCEQQDVEAVGAGGVVPTTGHWSQHVEAKA